MRELLVMVHSRIAQGAIFPLLFLGGCSDSGTGRPTAVDIPPGVVMSLVLSSSFLERGEPLEYSVEVINNSSEPQAILISSLRLTVMKQYGEVRGGNGIRDRLPATKEFAPWESWVSTGRISMSVAEAGFYRVLAEVAELPVAEAFFYIQP